MKRFLCAVFLVLAGCATTTDPQQQAINSAMAVSQPLDQAVLATKAAYDAGKLSKADALKALAGFQTAQTGLKAGMAALSASSAASGSK
jgi:hypothetical protein